MRKLVILFIIPFLLASCTLSNIQYLSNKYLNNDKNLSLESANENDTKDLKNKSITENLDENTETGAEDDDVEIKETDSSNLNKVISIEEQYCISKGGKVIDEVCYATDDEGLVKCNVNVFYLDMCRDKSAKIEKGIVVSIPGYAKKSQLNNIANESAKQDKLKAEKNNLEADDKNNLKFDLSESIVDEDSSNDKDGSNKFIVEKNIGNGFIFKEDESNKYLYLNSKLISKLDKSSRILMNSSEDDDKIISFNIYSSKTSSSPSKTLYVDMETKSIVEKQEVKTDTQTGEISTTSSKNDSNTSKTEVVKSDNTSMINSKSGKSGTYYISGTSLKLKTTDGEVKSIFTQSGIYDYELMLNKQIKVFYKGSDGNKEDKIINIP